MRFHLILMLCCSIIYTAAKGQNTISVSGTVKNGTTKELIPAVSVTIKGSTAGTYTDEKGNFKLITNTQKIPFTIVVSSVGYTTAEVQASTNNEVLTVEIQPAYALGQEIVVAASRVPERILESPVSVERVNTANIRNAPASNYYDIVGNLKGVDLTTSSLTFKTPSTRGFNGSGNTRFNQIVDGMDNQAPGLNFSVGSIIGLTELDVDNMELLGGASSALYGPGGMNGTLLINSKDPFKYQGVSVQVKEGVMHLGNSVRSASPYHDLSLRWGQKIGEKFAFKVSAQYIEAKDWVALDYNNYDNINNVVKGGNRENDPAYNGANLYGDEIISQIPDMLKLSNLILDGATQRYVYEYQLATGSTPTQDQIDNFLATNAGTQPFFLGVKNGLIKNQVVTRTGYKEKDIIDPTTKNAKISGGLYYKINDNLTASIMGYYGTGNSVYTGSDRYSLKNLKVGQYKAELKSKNWFLRGYTTQENSGDAFNATVNTELFNEAWKPSVNPANLGGSWYPQYIGAFVQAKASGADDATAHGIARAYADQGRPEAGSSTFNRIFDSIAKIPIPNGGHFLDRSNLYMIEGQYNLTDALKLRDKGTDILIGGNWKEYVLKSQGTLFYEVNGKRKINEYGGYLQIVQKLFKDVLKLTVSGRYDKNQYFDGQFTPRASAVIQVAKNNNIRLSYQNAYRFPTTQNQWINLKIGGNSILIGGLPDLKKLYGFDVNTAYTQESFAQFAATGNPMLLQERHFDKYKPETANSYEIGYKGLLANDKLLIDAYFYYARYHNFLTRINVIQSPDSMVTGFAKGYIGVSVAVNSPDKISTHGYGISFEYLLPNNFSLNANFFSDEIKNVPTGYRVYYNTPKYRTNLGVSNSGLGPRKNIGFNIIWRWQDAFFYEGDFVSGNVKAFSTLDAQVSYRFSKIRSIIKLGATNLTNHYYLNAAANPSVGGLYYISLGYNVF